MSASIAGSIPVLSLNRNASDFYHTVHMQTGHNALHAQALHAQSNGSEHTSDLDITDTDDNIIVDAVAYIASRKVNAPKYHLQLDAVLKAHP